MNDIFARTQMIIGPEGLRRLQNSRVAIFGLGGVGSYAVEALARAGIGHFVLIDNDVVAPSNINRQLIALHSTLGQLKVEVARARILDINPTAEVEIHDTFILPENAAGFIRKDYDYLVDAIDTVCAKVELIFQARKAGIPVISCMGTGNKMNPTGFVVADIFQTKYCPLSKAMRRELRKRGIDQLKVVYSPEKPVSKTITSDEDSAAGRHVPGSISFVPPAAGLILAGQVVQDLIK
ncbi:MAG: tRNA threonylcarbamoyladenosine dehydratase [Saccharofermentanales bacterium]|jgi:tRNA A37 threonylcarbamoyladenosine dehydratase|nr:tRNA threonylcarbamoyladenosine dehydratase [Clostridiaceae bacterium]